MYNKVELCGVDTAQLPILSERRSASCSPGRGQAMQKGPQAMIEGNLRFVLSVVQRFAQRGENPGRPVSGGVHRANQGHRQLRPGPAGAVFHLRRADDHRRDTAVPAGQQRPAGQPQPPGHGLPGHADPASSWKRNWAVNRPWRRSPGRPGCPAGKWRRLWNRWWSPSASRSPFTPMAGTPCMLLTRCATRTVRTADAYTFGHKTSFL